MVCWLAKRALADNKHSAILTRGYRGSAGSSDEASMLHARLGDSVPIGVGANRYEKGKELGTRGAEWIILDDGFQHLQLARDADIVLIDAANPFGGGHLLPAGRLREPISALCRAQLVMIMRSRHTPAVEAVVRRYSDAPIHHALTTLERFAMIPDPGAQFVVDADSVDWMAKKFFVFCGIGNPKAFLSDLERWGASVTGSMIFRDHHTFTPRDINEIERRARTSGADILLCTEKDTFNLKGRHASEFPVAYCRISLEPVEPERFWQELNSIVVARRGKAAR